MSEATLMPTKLWIDREYRSDGTRYYPVFESASDALEHGCEATLYIRADEAADMVSLLKGICIETLEALIDDLSPDQQ